MFRIPYLFLILFALGCSTTSSSLKPVEVVDYSSFFANPLRGKYTITQRFKPASNKKHKGVDLAGRKHSPIFSVGDGRVVYVGKKFRGYGLMILIEHQNGYSSLYSHLNKAFVKANDQVRRGQHIGAMGKTGRATGVHLHFEIMKDKIPINPEIFIKF